MSNVGFFQLISLCSNRFFLGGGGEDLWPVGGNISANGAQGGTNGQVGKSSASFPYIFH
jgi:hypothetical protein